VNFQIMNATAPRTAMPPATDRPMIVPVPTEGPLSSPFVSVADGEGDVEDEDELESLEVTVTKLVLVSPMLDDCD